MPDVLRVDVRPQEVEVTPGGAPASVEARIFNGTSIIDEFKVAVIGTGQWLDAPATSVRLFPDKEDGVRLTLAIPPGQFVPAGPRVVGLQVTSTSNPALSDTTQLTVTVAAVAAEVVLTVQPQIVRGGKTAELTATVTNSGNTPLGLQLTGEDAERAARFGFSPQQLEVPPGGQTSSHVRVSAPREFFGTERQRQLTIRAEGGHSPLAASATFLQAPAFTTGSLRWLRTVLTILAAAMMVGGAFMTWTTVPDLRAGGREASHAGVELDYQAYANAAFDSTPENIAAGTNVPEDVVRFFTSAGFVAIFFGIFVALGMFTKTGKMTRVAGALCLIVIVALFAVLYVFGSNTDIARGALVAAGGSLLAIVGGSIGT